ncbi:MAG: UDP-N-acetylmuramoyl-L-alanyl-D-glutamate--2,6-diaminopimelate ligase [Chlamydiales bacterium]|jgi:UDP-N-acetylmuramoyl-L-alanyl-D-glutamate--2,6-diaminopimelate ligase
MKLKILFNDIPEATFRGPKDISISGICSNSKLITPGDLFIAKNGKTHNGNKYTPEAITRGAVAILTDLFDPLIKNTIQIVHPDVEGIEGLLAAIYFDNPSEKLLTVGITGTNGKTTCAYLIKHLFDHMNKPCGLIGSIEYLIGSQHYLATRTTPDVVTNHKLLSDMIRHNCNSAVMEVSSHALVQNRVEHINFDIALFTNLSQDHLDYHRTMEEYCLAKSKLFTSLDSYSRKEKTPPFPIAVINNDCPWTPTLLSNYKGNRLSYGIDNPSDLQASKLALSSSGSHFDVHYLGKTISFFTPLIGRHNIYNNLAAISCSLLAGATLTDLSEPLTKFQPVCGRLDYLSNDLNIHIYVDYAHTPNALENVLKSLRECSIGRIFTVFGCGGDRDSGKRSEMGAIVEKLSDVSIVTSDNPRSENPLSICQDILEGFIDKSKFIMEIDRKKAIELAIDLASPHDTILIAGKGHETYQVFARKTVPFNDREIASKLCIQKSLGLTDSHTATL